jgi:hypothetical protein
MRILNLTQHGATQDQLENGVVDCVRTDVLKTLLEVRELPSQEDLWMRANNLVTMVVHRETGPDLPILDGVMIGGAPYLMGVLEIALRRAGYRVFYAFSQREIVEESQPDGSVWKVAVFRHKGFVEGAAHWEV